MPKNLKKFPLCSKYGLEVWDNDDLGNIEQEGIDAYEVELALSKAENEKEIWKKSLRISSDRNAEANRRIELLERNLREKTKILQELHLNWNVDGNHRKIAYNKGYEQGKLDLVKEISDWLSTRNEEYTINGERATEDYNWGLNDAYVRLKSQIKEVDVNAKNKG